MFYLFYQVNKSDIHYLKHILEAYENMIQVSTVDEALPKLQLSIAPDFVDDVLGIIQNLQKSFFLKQLDDDPHVSQGNY
ncbi:MAG: hypothetical protein ACD_62C00543G0006 [uncultured bacterium]|nr:MAG: hypothetical protein ACD_62C00543G0006 [uncultured bacterium]HLD44597.1 DUF4911 domain-containing protein [bacterium]